jgi:hypothetical protein
MRLSGNRRAPQSDRQIEASLNGIKSQLTRLDERVCPGVSDSGYGSFLNTSRARNPLPSGMSSGQFSAAMKSVIRQLEDGKVQDVDDVLLASLKSTNGTPGDAAMRVRDVLRLVEDAIRVVVDTVIQVADASPAGDVDRCALDTLRNQLQLADSGLSIARHSIPTRHRRGITAIWRAIREWVVAVGTLSYFGETRERPHCLHKPKPDWDVLRHTVALVRAQHRAVEKYASTAYDPARDIQNPRLRQLVPQWEASRWASRA